MSQLGKLTFTCALACALSHALAASEVEAESTSASESRRLPRSSDAPALTLSAAHLIVLVERCSADGGVDRCRPVTGFLGFGLGSSFYLDQHWSIDPFVFGALQPGDEVTVSATPRGSEAVSRGAFLGALGAAGRYYPTRSAMWLSSRAQLLLLRDITIIQTSDAEYSWRSKHTLGAALDFGFGLDWPLTRALGLAAEGRIGVAFFPEVRGDAQRESIGTGPFVSLAATGLYSFE